MAGKPARLVRELAGRHLGETVYIVGRGPSLLGLAREDFTPGPVIALNAAIVQVRALGLPNRMYLMQQDGCLLEPIPPESVLLSKHLSANCWPDYPERFLFGIRGNSMMSSPCAVRIAIGMGAGELVMVAHDAYRNGSAQVVTVDGGLSDGTRSFPGYVQGAEQSVAMAERAGVPMRWLP